MDKLFFNAKLQGLLMSTYYLDFDMVNIVKSINQKLKQSPNKSPKNIFGEIQTVLSLKNYPIFLDYFLQIEKNPQLPQSLFTRKIKNYNLC